QHLVEARVVGRLTPRGQHRRQPLELNHGDPPRQQRRLQGVEAVEQVMSALGLTPLALARLLIGLDREQRIQRASRADTRSARAAGGILGWKRERRASGAPRGPCRAGVGDGRALVDPDHGGLAKWCPTTRGAAWLTTGKSPG